MTQLPTFKPAGDLAPGLLTFGTTPHSVKAFAVQHVAAFGFEGIGNDKVKIDNTRTAGRLPRGNGFCLVADDVHAIEGEHISKGEMG